MYEGACVAGNKVEAAYALHSQAIIMGNSGSSAATHGGHSRHQQHHNHHHGRVTSAGGSSSSSSGTPAGSKVYPRHSIATPAAAARREDQLYRDQLPRDDAYRQRDASIRVKNATALRLAGADRPVTISEMNAYNVEKSEAAAAAAAATANVAAPLSRQANREFYTVGEGYHKTEHCYYKTPDGGYHKLPPDSFHKMSEVCYTRQPDGSFRRLDALAGGGSSSAAAAAASRAAAADGAATGGGHHKVRNQMIRFLKRSKSHTPATIKELQRAKEKERERLQAAAQALERQHNGGNRVVVTMMESGGLPVVATTKPTPRRVEAIRETAAAAAATAAAGGSRTGGSAVQQQQHHHHHHHHHGGGSSGGGGKDHNRNSTKVNSVCIRSFCLHESIHAQTFVTRVELCLLCLSAAHWCENFYAIGA